MTYKTPDMVRRQNEAYEEIRKGYEQVLEGLAMLGEEPERGGLKDTPDRCAKAWIESWGAGYLDQPGDHLGRRFEDGAEGADEMIIIRDIPFFSHCEHHLAPIIGTAHVGYLPGKSVVGLSKINRVVTLYAHRLQVQERMTAQIADALMEHLECEGAGVMVRARHLCMESRGVRQTGHTTVTSATRGAFRDEPGTRNEFLSIVQEAQRHV